MKSINREEIDQITEYLDLKAPPKQADIAFVFGSMAMVPAQIATDLYSQGVVERIVVTGGVNRQSKKCEADEYRAFLQARGVPENRIIVEKQSANSRENVILSRKIIEKEHPDILPIQSVVVVSKWYHSRRATMTLKRNFFDGIRYYTATYPLHNISQSNWWKNDMGLRYVMKEWNTIPVYLTQDHIAEVSEANGAFV